MAKISSPIFRVTIEAGDDLHEVTVQTDNRDRVRFDMLRNRKGWPSYQDAPFISMSVMAWSAMHRSGWELCPDSADAALESIVDIVEVDADGHDIRRDSTGAVIAGEPVETDPTQ